MSKATAPQMCYREDGWPPCPVCGKRIGTIGYRDAQGRVICHSCVRGHPPGWADEVNNDGERRGGARR